MSIDNQKFGIPRKYQFPWYFIRILQCELLIIWLNIGILCRIKIGLVFGFCGSHFIGIGLVSVCNFIVSGISNTHIQVI